MILWLFLCLFNAVSSFEQDVQKSYRNYSLLGVSPNNDDQLQFLMELSHHHDLDFWNGLHSIGHISRALISPLRRKDIEEKLTAGGIQYSVLIDDLQEKIDEERRSMESSRKRQRRSRRSDSMSFFSNYHTFEEINEYMEELHNKHKKITSIHVIGETYKGNKLKLLQIGDGKATKPAIWIDSLIHAREWISGPTSLYTATQLLTKYGSDKNATKLVDSYTWYIMPVANPDGYIYTHTTDRFWRKNLSPTPVSSEIGIDLNRNFGYLWDTIHRMREPSSQEYQGVSAFSEFESQAISKFLSKKNESLKVYFSLHSAGSLWLTPFGRKFLPDNYEEMIAVARIGNNAMKSYKGKSFSIGPAYKLYECTGLSMDWVRAELKTKYSYSLELDTFQNMFETPAYRIVVIGEEIWRAIKAITLHLIKNKI